MSFEFIEQDRERYGPPAPVPILQEEIEFARLLELYVARKPKRVLELGTYAGGTLFHWMQNAAPGTLIVSVDADHQNPDRFWDWLPVGVECKLVHGDTRDPEILWEVSQLVPYDFIFVDAGHLDEEVRADWENYRPMVRPGGLMAFHDIKQLKDLPRIQVFHLWWELKARYPYIEIQSPDGSGIGVVIL